MNQIGDEIIFNPLFYDKISENPFKLEQRKFPIDFAYKTEKTYIVYIALPENYEVAGLPKPLQMNLPDHSASFLYQITNKKNSIVLSFRYNINKAVFTPAEYNMLREFFVRMVKKNSEFVILKIK